MNDTDRFNLYWQNDRALYNAILSYVESCREAVPGMTRNTIAVNLSDRVWAWLGGEAGMRWGECHRGTGPLTGNETLHKWIADEVTLERVDWLEVADQAVELLEV